MLHNPPNDYELILLVIICYILFYDKKIQKEKDSVSELEEIVKGLCLDSTDGSQE